MNNRDVVKMAFEFKSPPYVPWQINLTIEAHEKLLKHYGSRDISAALDNHFVGFGYFPEYFTDIGNGCVKDYFGVIWDRSEDKDIGVVKGEVLAEPTLNDYILPDPLDDRFFNKIDSNIKQHSDCFRIFNLGFSLFERAWTLRGMENILMDFYLNPNFVKELLHAIADFNIAQMTEAVKYDIDCIYYGDDWGQQHGLIMGYPLWKEFIYPELKRMYAVGSKANKYVQIHSCGDVDELFDDLVNIGLNNFNPFQPEVMDVFTLIERYRGKLSFFGGLSTQQTLPYGSVADVRKATRKLLDAGKSGGLVFSPAHAVEGDVPVENLVAMLDELKQQKCYGLGL